jgi:hypothetical protein
VRIGALKSVSTFSAAPIIGYSPRPTAINRAYWKSDKTAGLWSQSMLMASVLTQIAALRL